MNISGLLGVLVAVSVVWFGVVGHSVHPEMFLDPHALILVLGGTLAAGLIAFPLEKFSELLQFFFAAVRSQEKEKFLLAKELLELAAHHVRKGGTVGKVCSHPLLQEGYNLVLKRSVSEADYRRILLQNNQRYRDQYLSDARMLTALSKFPPAFGLLGATTGMISMLTGLSSSGNGQSSIGPSMAVALVATFWGIALSNFVILPFADRANKLSADEAQLRTMIITGLVLLYESSDPATLVENVGSYLTPRERQRQDWKQLEGQLLGSFTKPRAAAPTPVPKA